MLDELKDLKLKTENRGRHYSDKDTGRIISSLSHELRVPLSILRSNLQLLKNKDSGLDEDLRDEAFSLCERAVASVTRFLDDIHFVNIYNKGELRKESTLFDIGLFIDQILDQGHTSFYHSKRIVFNTNPAGQFFYSDKLLLSRMVTCLLDNAYKFSRKEITLNISVKDKQLNIEIEDQGYGIPRDQMKFIFTPFYRGENVKMISGSGLGLSVVKAGAECLNGNLFLDSIVLKGTRVKLIIPSDE